VDDQAISVPFDVKDDDVVAKKAGTGITLPNVLGSGPPDLFSFMIPGVQLALGINVLLTVFDEGLSFNHIHCMSPKKHTTMFPKRELIIWLSSQTSVSLGERQREGLRGRLPKQIRL
jgi:hypothetical protein